MQSLRAQPGLHLLVPYCLGIVLAQRYSFPLAPLAAFALLSVVLLAAFYRSRQSTLYAVGALLSIIVLAIMRFSLQVHYHVADHILHHISTQSLTVEGVIVSRIEQKAERRSFIIEVDSVWHQDKGRRAVGRVQVQLYDSLSQPAFGDRWLLKGFLRLPMGERNPGDFNYRRALAAKGIFATLTVAGIEPILLERRQGPWLDQNIFVPVADHVHRFLNNTLTTDRAAILYGLLIGDRSEIDDEVEQDFRDTGVVHVLAVSGLHVGYVIAAGYLLLKLLPLPLISRTLVLLAGIWFYANLTGLHSPVARASLMAGLFLLAPLLQRRAEPVNVVAIAGLVILLIHPLHLFMPAFQLSFAACLGIILLYQRLRAYAGRTLSRQSYDHKSLRWLLDIFVLSLCAQLATLPLVLYYFNNVPLIALIANLPVIPLTGCIMILGFASAICSPMLPALAAAVAVCSGWLVTVLVKMVHFFSELPFSHFSVPRPSLLIIWITFLLMLLFLYWSEEAKRKRCLVLITMLLNLYIWEKVWQEPNQLRVTFFDVSQGDASLFEFPDQQTLLVDAGDRTERIDYGERVIASYLRRTGIRRLDNVVITHPHKDHLGGITYVLEHFRVDRLFSPKIDYGDSLTVHLDSLARVKRIPHIRLCQGDTVAGYRHTSIVVLNPDCRSSVTSSEDLNERSIVLKILFGRTSFLLMGDAGVDSEASWLDRKNLLQSDVIKVGHHGSNSASSSAFCELVKPQFAVVSVGRYNQIGRAHV